MVSIIVPVYNIERYLPQCMNSLFAQTAPDFEVILVDDGSTDGSAALCDQYAKQDARVQVIHKKNGGLSSARNAGLDAATRLYLLFLDGDDYLAPSAIQSLLEIASANADFDFIQFQYAETDGSWQADPAQSPGSVRTYMKCSGTCISAAALQPRPVRSFTARHCLKKCASGKGSRMRMKN